MATLIKKDFQEMLNKRHGKDKTKVDFFVPVGENDFNIYFTHISDPNHLSAVTLSVLQKEK
jgi:hypothetical protein